MITHAFSTPKLYLSLALFLFFLQTAQASEFSSSNTSSSIEVSERTVSEKTSNTLLLAGTSEVSVTVRWRRWSSDNKVEVFDPAGNMLTSICNPNACYNASSNSFYTTTVDLGCLLDGAGYYIIMYDYYGDAWNGGGSYVEVTAGGTQVLYDTGAGTTQTGTTVGFSVSGGGASCVSIPPVSLNLDRDNDGIPNEVECPTEVTPIFFEDFTTIPDTDLVPDGTCGSVVGANPDDAGTYILTDAASSTLTGSVWQTPSGTLGNPSEVSYHITPPSGNFLMINSFGATSTGTFRCQDLSSDANGNGLGGEMVNIKGYAVQPGEYFLSTFFAELTNTNPHIGAYGFVIKNAVTGDIISNIAATTLPPNGGNPSPWYYNTGYFTLTETTDIEIILLQTEGQESGADIAIDNFALYRVGCSDSDGDGITDDYDLDSDNDGISDYVEAGGIDLNGDGQVEYATPGDPSTMIDVDNDGLADAYDNINSGNGGGEVTTGTPLALTNTDGIGKPNYLDIDSDDDGIVDNTEAQTTIGYAAPTGYDDDGDGLDNAYDVDCTGNCTNADGVTTNVTGAPITTPVDSEGDGAADYVDIDADNDGIFDNIEGHDTNGDGVIDTNDSPSANTGLAGGTADIDGDGLLDGFDNDLASHDPTNSNLNGTSHPDTQPGVTAEKDWREGVVDPCAGALTPDVAFDQPINIGLDDVSDTWASAWADYDNDGNVDLFVTTYSESVPNYLYKNNGDQTFTKVTTGDLVTDLASSLAATWGDYDNDGDLDLFVANNIGFENFLYRNDAGSFTKILEDPIVVDKGYAHGASWADYDNDGFLDLFVADYFSTKFNNLYHNNGDGTFEKVTSALPSLEASPSISGAWGDYNSDGLPDLFVANTENNNNSLYKNTGNGNFEKITTGAIVNDFGSSVGASWADYDNDGDLDLFVANSGDKDNFLYQNNGDETFTKITTGNIVSDGGHSHGSAWADYDNDGDLDLFVANDQGQDNFLYANNGDGTFDHILNNTSESAGNSFGSSWADYDNDGDLDLFVVNHNENGNFIFQNQKAVCGIATCINLEGTISNKSAIGAKVFLKANIEGKDVWQMREVTAQSGGGIGGQSELKVMIGTGNAKTVDSIIVEWNSGYRQILTNQTSGECLTIKEESANEICGIAYYDENGNCIQDGAEAGIPNLQLVVQPGSRSVTTDENGKYSVFVEPGTFTIEETTAGTNWSATCTTQRTVNVAGFGGTYCGNNFSNSASCASPDLGVEISATIHRVGFENLVAVTYKNEGTQTATNVNLVMDFGADIIPLESSLPWTSASGTERTWDLGNVEMGRMITIYIKDSVSTNTVVGEDVELIASISGSESDCDLTDNLVSDIQAAVGAIDPNDILVNPEGYIDNDQELVYRIRFQNVGNASVSTVRIENKLPFNLDVNTLELGAASHNYRFEMTADNQLTWSFENINMPDSMSNEPESHGFVTYKILPKEGLIKGNTIENTASIFFDNVDPIVTNTVVNVIGIPVGAIAEAGQLQIVPNPMEEESTLRIIPFDGSDVKIQSIFIFDLLGRRLFNQVGVASEQIDIEKGKMIPGYYMVQAIGDDGKEYIGKIIIR